MTNEDLSKRIKDSNLTAADIRKESGDMITLNQARQWLKFETSKRGLSNAVRLMLKLLTEKKINELITGSGGPSAPIVKSKLRDANWNLNNIVVQSQHAKPETFEPASTWARLDFGSEAKKVELKMPDTILNAPWMCYPSPAKVTLAEGDFKVKENKDGTKKIGFRYQGTLFAGDYHGEGDYQLDCVAVRIPNLRSGTFIIL